MTMFGLGVIVAFLLAGIALLLGSINDRLGRLLDYHSSLDHFVLDIARDTASMRVDVTSLSRQ